MNMKRLMLLLALMFLASSVYAKERTYEELANAILQDRLVMCPRVGFAMPNDDVFLMELDVNTYQAALDSKDMKLKALIAIKAIKSMPHLLKEEKTPFSEKEKEKKLRQNPNYKKLKAWYFKLTKLK